MIAACQVRQLPAFSDTHKSVKYEYVMLQAYW